MTESGTRKAARERDEELRSGLMDPYMRASGETIRPMGRVD